VTIVTIGRSPSRRCKRGPTPRSQGAPLALSPHDFGRPAGFDVAFVAVPQRQQYLAMANNIEAGFAILHGAAPRVVAKRFDGGAIEEGISGAAAARASSRSNSLSAFGVRPNWKSLRYSSRGIGNGAMRIAPRSNATLATN